MLFNFKVAENILYNFLPLQNDHEKQINVQKDKSSFEIVQKRKNYRKLK